MLEATALSGVARVAFSENGSFEQIMERNMGMSQTDNQSQSIVGKGDNLRADFKLGACSFVPGSRSKTENAAEEA